MKRLRLRGHWLAVLSGLICMFGCWAAAAEGPATQEGEPVLLGPLTREEVEVAVPEWVAAEVEAQPDLEVASAMVTALEGAEVTVFLGTWCTDSGRELPRLWRALDDLGVLNPAQIRYIGVDRGKSAPRKWVDGQQLQLVPTFVVRRGGQEQGRIVESSPNGIESDLLALLRGEKSGVISNSKDLETIREEDDHE